MAKRQLENLKFYKAIQGGQFLDTIVEPTEPTELIQKDLAHNESGVWRRVRHTKTSEQGKRGKTSITFIRYLNFNIYIQGYHCSYIDDVPVRMIKEELIVPKEKLNDSLKMVNLEPFSSVMLNVYDSSVSYGDDIDVQTAKNLGQLIRDQRVSKINLSMQVDQVDLEAGNESIPCTLIIKGLLISYCAFNIKYHFRCRHAKINGPRRILQYTLRSSLPLTTSSNCLFSH